MSKGMVNALKAQVRGLKYADLRGKPITKNMNSGHVTHIDLDREHSLVINKQKITNEFIKDLLSKHKNLISKDENGKENYRPFLKKVFTEMFEHAGATVPSDLIIEELITHYNQSGYVDFFYIPYLSALNQEKAESSLDIDFSKRAFHIDCNDPNCLKFSFSMENMNVYNFDNPLVIICDLRGSVEFKLKLENGNTIYRDGKVLLTIPEELKNYKAGDDNWYDKLTDIINRIIEYFKKVCEKLGCKFDTKIEYDSERSVKIEHNLGKPLKVIDKPDISTVDTLSLKA